MMYKLFPSPIGELHFSIYEKLSIAGKALWFPSPIGELHFSIIENARLRFGREVSVPYRGATFLNSVNTIQKSMNLQFPSPIGELHFSIGEQLTTKILE